MIFIETNKYLHICQAFLHCPPIQLTCCLFTSHKSIVWPCTFKHNKVSDTTTAQYDELCVDKLKIAQNPFQSYKKTKQLHKPHLFHTDCHNIVEGINEKPNTKPTVNLP